MYRSSVISCALSPNTDDRDVRAAVSMLFRQGKWKSGPALAEVRNWFRTVYGTGDVYLYQSGRAAMYMLLKALGIGEGDEVLIQAFTCVAVPNSILWAGARPVYADIDETLNIDPESIRRRITPKTRALVLQHTMGTPADLAAILRIAKEHKLLVIEDCAHALGAQYGDRPVGSFGDAAFFSFGRDKAVSSVWGGSAMILPGCRVKGAARKLKKMHGACAYPDRGWIFRQILHPVAFSVILPLYSSGIGKVLLVFLQRMGLLSLPVYPEEFSGKLPPGILNKYPNALAYLLMNQLKKLDAMVRTRKNRAAVYTQELPARFVPVPVREGASPLRYNAYTQTRTQDIERAKKHSVLLGNWYHHIIDPSNVRFDTIGYTPGSCPNAEKAAAGILNFPTLVSEKEQVRVIRVVS